MKKNRKILAIAATAIATSAIILAVTTLFFMSSNTSPHASPPAKWICKTFLYDIDNEWFHYPPVVGLQVNLTDAEGNLLYSAITNEQGIVSFGSGLPDGTYIIEWNWCGEHYSEEVTINCTHIIWEFTNYLPAKTINKWFYYDLPNWTPAYPPVVGLHVNLTDSKGNLCGQGITNDEGLVTFIVPDGTYTIRWMWGGEAYSEEITVTCDQCVYDVENYLQAKGGGGIINVLWVRHAHPHKNKCMYNYTDMFVPCFHGKV